MIEEKWLRATSLFHRVLLPNCSAFGCAVECAWSATTSHTEPLHRLSYKSRHTAKELKRWIKSTNSEARLKFHMTNDVICRFDVAQEQRVLSTAEYSLRAALKRLVLGLAVIEGKEKASLQNNKSKRRRSEHQVCPPQSQRKEENHMYSYVLDYALSSVNQPGYSVGFPCLIVMSYYVVLCISILLYNTLKCQQQRCPFDKTPSLQLIVRAQPMLVNK